MGYLPEEEKEDQHQKWETLPGTTGCGGRGGREMVSDLIGRFFSTKFF